MKTVKLTCQNCGANIEMVDKIAFCSYCGTKLMIDDESRTITHNHIHTERDEARIRENETKERIRLKELENEEKQKKRDNMIIYFAFGILIAVVIFSSLMAGR